MKIESEKNNIKIRNNFFLVISIVALIMTVVGLLLLNSIIHDSKSEDFDVLGVVFVSVWVCVVFVMGIISLLLFSKDMIINNDGIICSSFIKKIIS